MNVAKVDTVTIKGITMATSMVIMTAVTNSTRNGASAAGTRENVVDIIKENIADTTNTNTKAAIMVIIVTMETNIAVNRAVVTAAAADIKGQDYSTVTECGFTSSHT